MPANSVIDSDTYRRTYWQSGQLMVDGRHRGKPFKAALDIESETAEFLEPDEEPSEPKMSQAVSLVVLNNPLALDRMNKCIAARCSLFTFSGRIGPHCGATSDCCQSNARFTNEDWSCPKNLWDQMNG